MPYTWNIWTCYDIPNEGGEDCTLANQYVCAFPYDPSDPYKSTWCDAPLSDQEAAPYGGNFYNTIIIRESSNKLNDFSKNFSKNLIIYSIYFAIVMVGIAILVLIL